PSSSTAGPTTHVPRPAWPTACGNSGTCSTQRRRRAPSFRMSSSRSPPPVPTDSQPLALSWSGGKDSALALWTLRRSGTEPQALVTTVTETYNRISMHGVRRELLIAQADALAIPLIEVAIPPACSNDVYEERLAH